MNKLVCAVCVCTVLLSVSCKSMPEPETSPVAQPIAEKIPEQKPVESVPKPEPKPVSVQNKILGSFYFSPGSYDIDPLTVHKLDALIKKLFAQKIKKVIVAGFSARLDTTAEESHIALRRAYAVGEYLLSSGKFTVENIAIEDNAALKPKQPHSDISGRFSNRRVDIKSAK